MRMHRSRLGCRPRRRAAGALAGLILLAGCGGGDGGGDGAGTADDAASAPLVEFDTTTLRIETGTDTLRLDAEVARTGEQRAYGLMDREHLPAEAGMLFVYTEPQDSAAGFWMYRTRIPLDIAFLDGDGRIVSIRSMDPCPSPNPDVCRTYAPGVAYAAALEVNRGYFSRHGITVGDRVVVGGTEDLAPWTAEP